MKSAIPVKDAWKYCPCCGAETKNVGQQPFACCACGYRHYFSPSAAVGALIRDVQERMLFIVRGKDPGKGKLGLPGGFVDAGETAEQAVIREIREELNLYVTDFRYLASFPNKYEFAGVTLPVTDLFFVSAVQSLDDIVTQEGEIEGFRFLPAADVDASMLAFATHQQALAAFLAGQ
ncbi:MAG: NUDIX domain-containing protein [Planctomycetaceae bacterium]